MSLVGDVVAQLAGLYLSKRRAVAAETYARVPKSRGATLALCDCGRERGKGEGPRRKNVAVFVDVSAVSLWLM